MSNATFDVGRLAKLVVICLVLPVSIMFIAMVGDGLTPWPT
ncbi:MAG: hypothetical protein R2911_02470 [Caldilineaceae bacterium]